MLRSFCIQMYTVRESSVFYKCKLFPNVKYLLNTLTCVGWCYACKIAYVMYMQNKIYFHIIYRFLSMLSVYIVS